MCQGKNIKGLILPLCLIQNQGIKICVISRDVTLIIFLFSCIHLGGSLMKVEDYELEKSDFGFESNNAYLTYHSGP